jgi:ABC-type transporter Mla maintaining outer membrane lipid asymmetry ATPase subunit MlaF
MEQFKNYIRFRRVGKNQDQVTGGMVRRLGFARAIQNKSLLLFSPPVLYPEGKAS